MSPEQAPDEPQEPELGQLRLNGTAVRLNGSSVPVNGNDAHHDDGDPVADPIPDLDDLAWRPSYDRESVDRHLAAVEEEKGRLLAEIRLAEERAAAAEERCRTSATEESTDRDALLGTLMLAARAEMDRVETEQRAIVSAVHALAEEEATNIRNRAQADATAVREVVASLTSIVGVVESTESAQTGSADDAFDDRRAQDEDHVG